MTLTRVFPAPGESVSAMDRDWLLRQYAEPAGRASVRVNMITSLNGSATGSDGTSDSLTSRLDRRILGVIRELSDVVLVGAGTVRREGYVVPKKAALAVVTASGDLRGHRFSERAGTVLVLCPRSHAARVSATLGATGATVVPLDGAFDDQGGVCAPETIVRALRDRGFARILCEGGPVLAGRLFAADLVDEFCLTTSPRVSLGGPPLLQATDAASTAFSLQQLLLDEAGATYARWARDRPATP